MKNISISGSLVYPLEVFPINIQLGDTCSLLLDSYHTLRSGEFESTVTRLKDSKIALRFLDPASWV
jgi:hypothetical protein